MPTTTNTIQSLPTTPNATPMREPSPTFDIAISIDSIVAITKIPKKKILRMVENHDLLSTGALISYRRWTKKDGIIIKQGIHLPIVEVIFGSEMVKKFLVPGEDY